MTGEVLAVGASHKTAPLPLRERIALPDGRAARVMAELVGHDAVHEAVAISTCNRTELYLITADPVEAEHLALGILSRQAGLRPTETDRMVAILQTLNRETGLTILLIEHVMRAVMALASRILVLHHGAPIAEGLPADVVRHPAVLSSYLGAEAL